jgi:Fe-Mn family superoxide dismutase
MSASSHRVVRRFLAAAATHTYAVRSAQGRPKKDVGHGGLDEWFSGHGEGEGEATWGDWVAISPVKKKIKQELADGTVKEKTVKPGDIVGPCGVSDDPNWKSVTNDGKDPLKCMPRQKAHDTPKSERAELAREKRKAERDEGNRGKEPTRTRTFQKKEASDNEPTNPDLWEESKDAAKDRYTKWPSAYAVGHALKLYKEEGGGWRKKKASVGKHTLPKLPYAYDALEPHISEETLKFHHDKHHKSYVDGLNKAEKAIEGAREDGDYEAVPALNAALEFHAGGDYLHTLYWPSLVPTDDYEEPSEELVEAIEADFGSWEAFRAQMKESMVKVRGSGWGVLVLTPSGLRVLTVMNHENGVLWDGVVLLPIDAWEHAYYLDYQNDRAAHFDAVFDHLVSWPEVERRLTAARDTVRKKQARTVAARYYLRG